ncbi:MAG: hypothetical protein II453_14540 [Alphaproteobacteria bacterium]|nr:hypothetical protein [Alphaproteobacteria bacterium]
MRIKLIIACFLIAGAVLGCWLIKYQHDRITALETKITEYQKQAEKDKKDVLEKSKRIQELNKVIQNSKDSREYSGIRIDSSLLAELRKQYLRKGN